VTVTTALGRARTLAILRALDLRLRRHGGRLDADVDPSARIDGPIELRMIGAGVGQWELALELGPRAWVGRGIGVEMKRGRSAIRAGAGVWIASGVRFRLHGGAVGLGAGTQVREYTRFHVGGELEVGRDSMIGLGCDLYCDERVELHDHTGLAHGVTVIDHDHAVDGSDTWWADQPHSVDPVVIGRNTIVSAGARVLRGARLGRNSVVGANAVVRAGDYPDRSVLVGSPARVVKTLGE
jgi:acetyltransferase-like isoleucine patch superfamily enzyme